MVDDDVAHGAPLPSTPGGPCLPTRGTHSLGPDFGDAVQRDLGGGRRPGQRSGAVDAAAESYLMPIGRQNSGCARFRRSCSRLVTLARSSRWMSTSGARGRTTSAWSGESCALKSGEWTRGSRRYSRRCGRPAIGRAASGALCCERLTPPKRTPPHVPREPVRAGPNGNAAPRRPSTGSLLAVRPHAQPSGACDLGRIGRGVRLDARRDAGSAEGRCCHPDPAARCGTAGTSHHYESANRRVGASPPHSAHAAGSDRGQPRAWRDIPAQALRDPWRARVAARSRAAPGRGERVLAHGPRPCGRTRALATAPRYRPPLWTRRECPAVWTVRSGADGARASGSWLTGGSYRVRAATTCRTSSRSFG